jgi:hypothetical protein
MDKQTFILFGRTNPWIANRDVTFKGRTHIAHNAQYCTRDKAAALLFQYCCDEDDNYSPSDDGSKVMEGEVIIMSMGDMGYEHDSRTWYFATVDALDENEATIAVSGNALSPDEREEVFARFPQLRAVEQDSITT